MGSKKFDWFNKNSDDPALGNGGLEQIAKLHEKYGAADMSNVDNRRWGDALIEKEIPTGASVLDLGCGEGFLLARLMKKKGVRGQGVELDPANVARCVERGVSVFQIDLDNGLRGLPDNCFDYVVLEETLQTLHRPIDIMREMLRVGKRGVVSFPNFGYWRVRVDLLARGKMPITEGLPFKWYDTPNIHFFTLQDFFTLCKEDGVTIVKGYVLREGKVGALDFDNDNLAAEEALMIVEAKQ